VFHVHDEGVDRHVSESLLETGTWEPFETEVIRRLLAPGALFVDCGANLGWYSVLAAAHGMQVLAIEPSPANAELLAATLERNTALVRDRIELHRCAVGAASGQAYLELSATNQGDHRVVATTSGRRSSVHIPIITIDAILAGRRPDLVKIDTQGSEVAILRGGAHGLGAGPNGTVPSLIVEFWPYGLRHCGSHEDELLEALEARRAIGHDVFEIREWNQTLRPCDATELRRMVTAPGYRAEDRGFTNLAVLNASHRVLVDDLVRA
jgi:FkbM family methyltransferase